jgi:hypothetical protein
MVCFGLAGLLWSLPSMRKRRQRRAEGCTICARQQRLAAVLVACLAVLLLAGGLARAQAAATPQVLCHSRITPDGRVQPEPLLTNVSPPRGWNVTRNVLVAPAGGFAVLAGRAVGMESCSGPPLLVMFWEPPHISGGGTEIGDVFVAWMPADDPGTGALSTQGYGLAGEPGYLRYGPNISRSRVSESDLARHESRHVDQGAIGTILAGPLAFPLAYVVDGAFFPSSRNHFERHAGLEEGAYPIPTDYLPAPRWPDVIGIGLVAVLILRRRIRRASRLLFTGRARTEAHAPGRCPIHTKGWVKPSD